MKYIYTKQFFTTLFATLAIFSFTACDKAEETATKECGPCFTINGTINNAEGKVLYFANESLGGTQLLDSVKIGDDGKFEFSKPKHETFEFYVIGFRDGTPVVIAVDSTETITLTAEADNIKECRIEGSPESEKIREMSGLIRALEQQIAGMKPDASYLSKKAAMTEEFKDNIARQYIIPSPDKASAYFALWLVCKNDALFKPFERRTDSKYYAAVATSMKRMFPEAQRTKHICDIAERGMKMTRPVTIEDIEKFEAMASEAKVNDIFEISLPNRDGDSISLSSLKGKVTLLDFTVYEDSKIRMRNVDLRELHDKYAKAGLEIYQVSLDSREHFWQQEVLALPWKCVRDSRGAASPHLVVYNVFSIPTFFLIDKNGEIVLRDAQIENLAKEIEKLLKK